MKNISMEEAVRLCREGEAMAPKDRRELVQERLRELVAYAKEHSRYFKEAYRDVKEDFKLSDLPFTTKSALMEDYGKWVTDPEVTHAGVTAYLSGNSVPGQLYLGKYSALTTSGTTGAPMPMVRDLYHNTIHGALMQTRLLRETDPDIMAPVRHKIAAVIFPDPSISSYSSFLRMKQAYPGYEDNILAASLCDPVDEVAVKLNAFQPDFISGYPSVMASLAKAAGEEKLHIHPKAVACSAEVLTEKVYRALKETFGCPILNNYCSTEGGEAAMSCGDGKLHINEDWVIIEPVDKDGKPAAPGEWSDGIYITDLTNYVQPVIRYYMNDHVRILPEGCNCGSTLPVMEIMGRTTENITVGGKELFGINVEHLLMYVEGVYSIQLVQKKTDEFEIRMVPSSEENRAAAFEKASGLLHEFFRENGCPPVHITLGEQPPVHNKRGGKVKFIVKEEEEKEGQE